jgi:hypothetical protein
MFRSKDLSYPLLVIFFLLPLVFSCKTVYIPVAEKEYVTVRDSVYLRDTTVQYKVEKEYVKDYTGLLDTLRMETSYAASTAYVDTTRGTLVGEIKNKENVINVPVQVKEKVTVRDSIVYKEVPVEVEKIVKTHYPYEKWLWIWLVFSLLGLGLFVYFRYFAARKFL